MLVKIINACRSKTGTTISLVNGPNRINATLNSFEIFHKRR